MSCHCISSKSGVCGRDRYCGKRELEAAEPTNPVPAPAAFWPHRSRPSHRRRSCHAPVVVGLKIGEQLSLKIVEEVMRLTERLEQLIRVEIRIGFEHRSRSIDTGTQRLED